MPKYLRTFLAAGAAAGALVLAAAAASAAAPADKATYDRILALAGDWTGQMEDPLAGPRVDVRFEVASGGKAVIEYLYPSDSLPAVTVYFLASGRLRAVQYSPAGNQPAYRLGAGSNASLALFEFDGGTGFDPNHDGHVHKGELRFVAADRIEHRWFHYVGPKEQGVTQWFLVRKLAVEKPAAAPATVPAQAPAPTPANEKNPEPATAVPEKGQQGV